MANKPELFTQREISFTYTDWRGVTRERRVVPMNIFFGTLEHYEDRQWFMTAFDVERKDLPIREFAMKDIEGMK